MFLFWILTIFFLDFSYSIHITNFRVPRFGDPREDVQIVCEYNLEDDDLFSVKFYKNEEEFFRFMPSVTPKIRIFALDGVSLSPKVSPVCNLNLCNITLSNLSRIHTSGTYKCEISSEAPSFHIGFLEANMSVLALPRGDPKLSQLRGTYFEGDIISANCTAPPADPPPNILFFINERKVSPDVLVTQEDSEPDQFGLITRSQSIKLIAMKKIFTPYLRIRCDINASPEPTRSTTQIIPLALETEFRSPQNDFDSEEVTTNLSSKSIISLLLLTLSNLLFLIVL